MSTIYQKFYDKTMDLLLSFRPTKFLVLLYFKFLMWFHSGSIVIGNRFAKMELHSLALVIATLASRLKFSGLFITVCLFILYSEMHFQSMARFYKKNPTLLMQHFPEGQDPKRKMHRMVQAVIESLSNPLVAATATGVAGAVGWKALDVYEVVKQGIQQDKQIEAENLRQEKQIEVENLRQEKQIETENLRQNKQIETEAAERERDRLAEAAEREKDRLADYLKHKESLEAEAVEREKDRQVLRDQKIDAEDRRHKESLEAKNQDNRDTPMAEDMSSTTTEVIESSLSVD